jgi:hypothetical protein
MEELVIEEKDDPSSALHVQLGDVLAFIQWMHHARKSLDGADASPTIPDVASGKVKGWIHLIQQLGEGVRGNEERILALEQNVIAHEVQLKHFLSHLHANTASLYDNLGRSHKAEEVRRRAEALHC